ncbi:hypothetical protein HG531_000858 [Fusarium graminearum]|nr:hypothetical protein HG531_000858 [Fusarium graminearum]
MAVTPVKGCILSSNLLCLGSNVAPRKVAFWLVDLVVFRDTDNTYGFFDEARNGGSELSFIESLLLLWKVPRELARHDLPVLVSQLVQLGLHRDSDTKVSTASTTKSPEKIAFLLVLVISRHCNNIATSSDNSHLEQIVTSETIATGEWANTPTEHILPEKAAFHINGHIVGVDTTSFHLTHVKDDSAFIETVPHEGVATTLGSELDIVLLGKCDRRSDIFNRSSLNNDSWVGVAIVQIADEDYASLPRFLAKGPGLWAEYLSDRSSSARLQDRA